MADIGHYFTQSLVEWLGLVYGAQRALLISNSCVTAVTAMCKFSDIFDNKQ